MTLSDALFYARACVYITGDETERRARDGAHSESLREHLLRSKRVFYSLHWIRWFCAKDGRRRRRRQRRRRRAGDAKTTATRVGRFDVHGFVGGTDENDEKSIVVRQRPRRQSHRRTETGVDSRANQKRQKKSAVAGNLRRRRHGIHEQN